MASLLRRIQNADHHDLDGHRLGRSARSCLDRKGPAAPGKKMACFAVISQRCEFFYSDELNC